MGTKYKWMNQFVKLESASKFHNKVREIFATDPVFANFSCYQEINVCDLVEGYYVGNHHYDWYIEELNTVVELHGQQHYKVTNWGDKTVEEAERAFYRMKNRDSMKKAAAERAGYNYIEISYKEYKNLDSERLRELIFGSINNG